MRNADRGWYASSDHYKISTLFIFGEFLAIVRSIERELGYLPHESTNRGKSFNAKVYGPFRAMTSFAYFRTVAADADDIGASGVPRLMLTAIGEKMLTEQGRVREFTDFATLFSNDPRFRKWFDDLDKFLLEATTINELSWDRLIALGANLRLLVTFLDPKSKLLDQRDVANLDLIKNQQVRSALNAEIAEQ
ncbi:hypothetical protein FCN77_23100 [Arthrobacter sp. 24S4-2]|uniref:hypothetical protein n=1 Tax=Arthrobacter sp. 24S4-2 TaxID=2575374 RepID=UPI0010C7C680|nr:hypothetical protein [Arthrobacter sp. 24S4-2]QCP00071.1 hypothetical protein FCN77_23100 [Arthrobacter sp. 24S4-2]